jgi:hypothetical protein
MKSGITVHSNFKNWCTVENSDASATSDATSRLVQFITGLNPLAVSVYGLRDRYPEGGEGFLWTDARVRWSKWRRTQRPELARLSGERPRFEPARLEMLCAGGDAGAMLRHSDQYRGLEYAHIDGPYSEPSPDYFQYVPLSDQGLRPSATVTAQSRRS